MSYGFSSDGSSTTSNLFGDDLFNPTPPPQRSSIFDDDLFSIGPPPQRSSLFGGDNLFSPPQTEHRPSIFSEADTLSSCPPPPRSSEKQPSIFEEDLPAVNSKVEESTNSHLPIASKGKKKENKGKRTNEPTKPEKQELAEEAGETEIDQLKKQIEELRKDNRSLRTELDSVKLGKTATSTASRQPTQAKQNNLFEEQASRQMLQKFDQLIYSNSQTNQAIQQMVALMSQMGERLDQNNRQQQEISKTLSQLSQCVVKSQTEQSVLDNMYRITSYLLSAAPSHSNRTIIEELMIDVESIKNDSRETNYGVNRVNR